MFLHIVSFSTTMESFYSFSDYLSYNSLTDFRQISPVVQTHLKQVCVSLCCYFIATAVGAYLHILWNIGGLLTTFATLGCMFWLLAIPPCEEPIRVSLIMAFALLKGASLLPIIKLPTDFDPSILVSAFIGNAIAYACFSGAATLTRCRRCLYLGGFLYSGVSIFFWVHFASKIFGGDVALVQYELYFVLLAFVGYMVVQTQVLVNILKFYWEGAGEQEEDGDYGEKLHSTTNIKAM